MATTKKDSSNNVHNYDIDSILKLFSINNKMPQELKQYVYTTEDIVPGLQDECISILKNISSLLAKGTNPNDINFRNTIKMNVNKLNHINYQLILDTLTAMTFTSEINISMLITELVQGSIIVTVAYKGYSMNEFTQENRQKSVPELCADIFREFCSYIFKINDKLSLNFHSISLKILKKYFDSYMQHERKMDENNSYNSDNFKGFMTFLGLLYIRNIVSENIILYCLQTILTEIFVQDTKKNTTIRNNTECTNLFGGYKHLLEFVILKNKIDVDKSVSTHEGANDNELLNQFKFVQSLVDMHQTIIRQNTKVKSYDNKNTLVVPLRPMSIISTKSLGEQLNTLLDKFPENIKENMIKYTHQ